MERGGVGWEGKKEGMGKQEGRKDGKGRCRRGRKKREREDGDVKKGRKEG